MSPLTRIINRKVRVVSTRMDENALKGAYVSLVADVPELYAKFGFSSVRSKSQSIAKLLARYGSYQLRSRSLLNLQIKEEIS